MGIFNSNKTKFYQQIQPYIDCGVLRPVYSGKYMCILSVGDFYYVACPYLMPGGNKPIAIKMPSSDYVRKYVYDEKRFLDFVKFIVNDLQKNKVLIAFFPLELLDTWKSSIAQKREKHGNAVSPLMDPELEAELVAFSKSHSQEPDALINASASPNPSRPVMSKNWTCTCGREHPSYVSTCTCGVNKRDVQQTLRKTEGTME